MSSPVVLIVDDEPNNFDVMETLLQGQDYQLHYSASGQEALDAVAVFQPDVILLDVMMPDLDGIEVCHQIKTQRRWQAVPIIMVTALNAKADLARCLEAGADEFISKPVNGLELRARVQAMLRIKQQYDRIESFSLVQRDTINILQYHLQELRGNLALTLSPELNTPLNGMLGALSLMLDHSGKVAPDDFEQLLDIAYQSANRLVKLTQRSLNYVNLGLATMLCDQSPLAQTTDLTVSGTQTQSVVLELTAMEMAGKMDRSADLTCQMESVELAMAESHLRWLSAEVMENAFKFSQPQTSVVVQGSCRDGMLQVQVKDQGQGMTSEQIARIGAFIQFERETYAQQGVGLGLKIAQKVVELYGGRFTVTSRYREETIVSFSLPLLS
jgi:DNA-binding response OmpR family regulator